MSFPGRHFLHNLVERPALVAQLVRRDFEQRYVGSAAGWLWGIVHPLVQLGVWWFVFQVCLKMTLPADSPTQNYAMFVMAGYLPWMLFQETVTRSAASLVDHANLITRTVFPSEVVAVSIFLSSLLHHLIGVVLVMGFALYTNTLSPMVLLLPVYMVFVGMLGVGIGWVASSLHVYLRDTGQVLSVVMSVWMWMTPIMISADKIPENYRFLIEWNPMSFVVEAYRARLLTHAWPDAGQMAVIAGYSVAVFLAGGLFFRHLKRGFADVL
ncbi:MAG: ABC transporter permease [Bryobacteraceae bacterium]